MRELHQHVRPVMSTRQATKATEKTKVSNPSTCLRPTWSTVTHGHGTGLPLSERRASQQALKDCLMQHLPGNLAWIPRGYVARVTLRSVNAWVLACPTDAPLCADRHPR